MCRPRSIRGASRRLIERHVPGVPRGRPRRPPSVEYLELLARELRESDPRYFHMDGAVLKGRGGLVLAIFSWGLQ